MGLCDEPPEPGHIFADWSGVTYKNTASIPPRALRLKTEARNCLTIALGHRDATFAGELIDEAIRLTRRAHELGVPTVPPRTKFR